VKRFWGIFLAALIAPLVAAAPALACSCVAPDKPTLQGSAAAATARLIEVRREGNGQRVDLVYKLLRVYKGSGRYHLREGENLVINTYRSGATCGLPRNKGKRYGLRMYRSHHELSANLCTVMSPKELRRAAERSGNARVADAGCGTQT